MEITTIIGIVLAVIICLVGLIMMLRKSDDAAPSLDSALHINEDSNQPVIPRHVRDQLRSSAETERVEPNLTILEDVDVNASSTEKAEPKPTEAKQTEVKPTETVTAEVTEENITAHIDQADDTTKLKIEKVEPTLDLQTASIVEKTETSNQEDITKTDTATSTYVTKPQVEAIEAFTPNTQVETVKIQEFEDESSILDVHLSEQQRQDDQSILANAERIIGLNVYPDPRRALSGDKTLKVMMKYGLRFGEMKCFHRYEDPENESSLMFSVLRIIDSTPAGFDLEALSMEQVQGLAFFLALPHPDVQKGFDTMVSIAGLIAREIDGTVYDENNLEFTPQLKEHWRHQAIDFRSGQAV